MYLSTATATDNPYPQIVPQADVGQVQSLLVFHLDERAYGISIEFVVQIIPMLKLTPVPQVEQVIEGVANIHGKVIPVMCARRHLGLPAAPARLYTPIILISTGERTIGLIVDEVAEVVHMAAGQMALPETIIPGGYEKAAVLSGIVYQGDEAIIVLDPRYLLFPTQMQAVSKAIQSLAKQKPQRKHSAPVTTPVETLPGGNGNSPEQEGGSSGEVETVAETHLADTEALATAAQARPEEKAEQASDSGNGAKPKNGNSKPRRKRRKLEATLAGEIASLAADLPPSEGQASDPGDSAPVPPDPKPSSED